MYRTLHKFSYDINYIKPLVINFFPLKNRVGWYK